MDPEQLKNEFFPFTKYPNMRTPEDIEKILMITSQTTFLKKITEEKNSDFIHREACKYFTIKVFTKNSRIINIGEIGEEFYIILQGSVGVYVPSKDNRVKSRYSELQLNKTNKNLPEPTKETKNFEKSSDKIRKIFEEDIVAQFSNTQKSGSESIPKVLKDFEKIEGLKQFSTLGPGECFGELALISDKPRLATIIAKENCVLAVLNKVEFATILGKEMKKSIEQKASFLQSLPIFATIPKSSLIKIAYFFTEVRFIKNQYVYKAGNAVENIYFVKFGEFKLAKRTDFKSRPIISQGGDCLLKFANVREKKQGIDIEFSIKGQNEIIGQEEVLEKKETREFSCKCISNYGVLYSIPKKDFNLRISNPDSKRFLKSRQEYTMIRAKNLSTTERILTEMSCSDQIRPSGFDLIFQTEESETMRKKLKNLRQKFKTNSVTKVENFVWNYPRRLSEKKSKESRDLWENLGKSTTDKFKIKNKGSEEVRTNTTFYSTRRKIKRVPPPNFMIGMRDLNRVYNEENNIHLVAPDKSFTHK